MRKGGNKLKTLITSISIIYIFCMSSGDILANEKKDSTPVEMSIYLIAGKDGAYLKHGKEGLVFIRMYNQAEKNVTIPLFYRYGKGRHGDLKPSYLTSDITFYAGFEIATVKYYFIDSGGNNIIENVIVCSPDSLNLSPKQYKLLSIPIRTPSKAGTYKFKLLFDNRNLEKAIDSYNFVDSNIKRNLFYSEILLEGITVKE